MRDALAEEQESLACEFDIAPSEFHFIDGSGGGDSAATPQAVVSYLRAMAEKSYFTDFHSALPRLAVDGSLATVIDFQQDQTLTGARGKVHAKTGTYILGDEQGRMHLHAQGVAGYIETRSGRRLAYTAIVNDVGLIADMEELVSVMQDQGRISAILWRDE
jgi:D-alanyl-D-alanine carboxypeptidase